MTRLKTVTPYSSFGSISFEIALLRYLLSFLAKKFVRALNVHMNMKQSTGKRWLPKDDKVYEKHVHNKTNKACQYYDGKPQFHL